MLITEHKADGLRYTHGDRIVCVLLSLLSWFIIIQRLVSAWIGKVAKTGYWEKEIDPVKPTEIIKSANGVHNGTYKAKVNQ